MYLTRCVAKIYLKYYCLSEITLWLPCKLCRYRSASFFTGSTLFFKQFMHTCNLEISEKLEAVRTTCIHLLKIASDSKLVSK